MWMGRVSITRLRVVFESNGNEEVVNIGKLLIRVKGAFEWVAIKRGDSRGQCAPKCLCLCKFE